MADPCPTSRVMVMIPFGSKKHDQRKKAVSKKFFSSLAKDRRFHPLLDEVPEDPSIPSVKTLRFFIELSGIKTKKKFSILNLAMMHFVKNHKRKKVAESIPENERGSPYDLEYQPSSFNTDIKTLFGIFKSHGIPYSYMDFQKPGTWLTWLYKLWEEAAKFRSDFGALPNQAQFDQSMDKKLLQAIQDGTLDYKNNYEHFVMLIMQLIGKIAMLRGNGEVSFSFLLFLLCASFFVFVLIIALSKFL